MIALFVKYWYLAAIAALIAALGVQQVRVSNAKSDLASYRLEVSNAQRIASELARKESDRRQQAFDDAARSAREENESLQKDVVRLADLADGLRGDIATLRKRTFKSPNPANGSKSEQGDDAISVLARVYERADTEAGVVAQYADRLRVAGLACESSVDQMK